MVVYKAASRVGPTMNFPETILASAQHPNGQESEVRINLDSGCQAAATTRAEAERQGLQIYQSDDVMCIEGIDGEVMETRDMAIMKIKADKRGSQILRIPVIVLPIEDSWFTPLPDNRPPWLSALAPRLADPEVADPSVKRVQCHVILGSDWTNRLHTVSYTHLTLPTIYSV